MASLSVLTLTRNRISHLEALRPLIAAQLGPADEWLIVDTGSTDGTREALAAWVDTCVRWLAWDRPGSWAEIRNFAVAQARGDLLAFLDDDCYPSAGWAARGRAQLFSLNGGCDAVGGIAQPRGITRFPSWWHPQMGWMVGLSGPEQATLLAGSVAYPSTSNLFVRAKVARAEPFQELGGSFDGSEAQKYAAGREDAEWWRRLRQHGYATRFDPELTVGHAIDPTRLDLKYLVERAARDGAAWAVREGSTERAGELIDTALYTMWREIAGMLRAPLRESGAGWPQFQLHRLQCIRHAAAARTLAEQWLNSSRPRLRLAPRLVRAFLSYTSHNTKAVLREKLGRWLRPQYAHRWRQPVERLGIVAFAYVGDLVILQGALRGLLAAHPNLDIYVLAPPSASVVLGCLRRVNLTILPGPAPGNDGRWFLRTWLERLDPDALVAPYLHAPWGDTLTRLGHFPCPIAGFDSDHTLARQWQQERLGVRVHKRFEVPEVANLVQLFAAVGLPCESKPGALEPAPASAARVAAEAIHAWAHESGGGLVILNPDSGGAHKEWRDSAWAELAVRLLAETPHAVAINVSKPHPELERLLGPESGRLKWLRPMPLHDFVAWLASARAVVSVDSGTQHLAQALGIPCVVLFGPSDERRWGDPFARPHYRPVRACTIDLTPDEKQNLPSNQEVLLISPAQVWAELESLLTGTPEIEPELATPVPETAGAV